MYQGCWFGHLCRQKDFPTESSLARVFPPYFREADSHLRQATLKYGSGGHRSQLLLCYSATECKKMCHSWVTSSPWLFGKCLLCWLLWATTRWGGLGGEREPRESEPGRERKRETWAQPGPEDARPLWWYIASNSQAIGSEITWDGF